MNMVQWLGERKEFLVTGGVVLTTLVFLPSLEQHSTINPVFQSLIASAVLFLVLPLLYCKIILKQPWSVLGLQKGSIWAGLGGSIIALVSGLIFLFGLMHFTPLFHEVHLPRSIEENFFLFLLYEVVLNGWVTLLIEVFFRGLVMFLWLRRLGFISVFIQAALFAGFIFLTDDMTPAMIPLLLFSPLAGLIAYQSRSLLASWGASWFFVFLADALILIVGT